MWSGHLSVPDKNLCFYRWCHMVKFKNPASQFIFVFNRPGGYCEETKPDPIPNSAVKLLSADGTPS